MEFRIRQIIGYLGHVGKIQLICSEFKKRPYGRTKYLACNDLKAKPRQILIGYPAQAGWAIEIFHKDVKMFLGFEDVATKIFDSVMAHVHWVYCAYILLHYPPSGVPAHIKSLADKQRRIKAIIDSKEKARVIQLLTQIMGWRTIRKRQDSSNSEVNPKRCKYRIGLWLWRWQDLKHTCCQL